MYRKTNLLPLSLTAANLNLYPVDGESFVTLYCFRGPVYTGTNLFLL